jgi:hypothetical protein
MAEVIDDLDESLTNSSKVAATLGDEFLVYMIDMAVLHVRKKAIHLADEPKHRKPEFARKNVVDFETARSHLSSLTSGIRSISTLQPSVARSA